MSLVITFGVATGLCARQAEAEFSRLAMEVEKLSLGFGGYKLGSTLSPKQKEFAAAHLQEKSLEGTYKFRDENVFVVAGKDSDTVLGMYKEYSKATETEARAVIGELMMRFHEPTTMAHEKIIYWAYGKNGRISKEEFGKGKQEEASEVLGIVKLTSSESIAGLSSNHDGGAGGKGSAGPVSEIYVIISSDPLSRLFLAMNR